MSSDVLPLELYLPISGITPNTNSTNNAFTSEPTWALGYNYSSVTIQDLENKLEYTEEFADNLYDQALLADDPVMKNYYLKLYSEYTKRKRYQR